MQTRITARQAPTYADHWQCPNLVNPRPPINRTSGLPSPQPRERPTSIRSTRPWHALVMPPSWMVWPTTCWGLMAMNTRAVRQELGSLYAHYRLGAPAG